MESRRTTNKLTGRSAASLTGALALLLALCLITGSVMPAYAIEPPPEMPHQFYGTVSFDGDRVEEATLVEAFVDAVRKAETTVDAEGRYGYDPIFRLSGTAGGTVTFYVGGVEADEDATWESGKVQKLNLTIHEEPAPPVQYELTIAGTTGGSVIIPGEGVFTYHAGAQVHLLAEAETGYQFVGWTAPAGDFDDETAEETIFTMPSQSVTVTASFEEVPLPRVTTQAATDITSYSAVVNMSYTTGNLSSVEVHFACKRAADQAWFYTSWLSETAEGTRTEVLTGLASQTEYEFKAQLGYDDTVIEGDTHRFTTAPGSSIDFRDIFCFIATAAYGTPTAKQINALREFRDVVLLKSTVGSRFVALYYRLSPAVADFVAKSELTRALVRGLLVDPIVWIIEATEDIWENQRI
jgi:uncharacterized repeat protein (TIGR02543 family)